MNIQQIINREIKYNYLNKVQASLDAYGMTLADLKTYERVGKSYYGFPDTIFTKRFGKKTNLPEHQHSCLCEHDIVQQCYLCPRGSTNVDDVIVVGNHCIKKFGFCKAINGDANHKTQCDLCGASVHKKGIARHQKRPCCIKNRKINSNDNNDNDTESTKSGSSNSVDTV